MGAVRELQIKNMLINGVKALGNTKYGLKEVCSDLINQAGTDSGTLERISRGTFLQPGTLKRMATLKETEGGRAYNPSSDTVERIMRYFGTELTANQVLIRSPYRNQPKKHADDE